MTRPRNFSSTNSGVLVLSAWRRSTARSARHSPTPPPPRRWPSPRRTGEDVADTTGLDSWRDHAAGYRAGRFHVSTLDRSGFHRPVRRSGDRPGTCLRQRQSPDDPSDARPRSPSTSTRRARRRSRNRERHSRDRRSPTRRRCDRDRPRSGGGANGPDERHGQRCPRARRRAHRRHQRHRQRRAFDVACSTSRSTSTNPSPLRSNVSTFPY